MQLARLKEWREARGLTQKELSRKAGVGEKTVARMELGDSVRPNTARKVAEALDVTVADLLEHPPVPLVPTAASGVQLEAEDLTLAGKKEASQSTGPPVVHFAKLSDNAYEEVRENARLFKELVDLRRRVDLEYKQLSRWVHRLQEEEGGAPSAEIEEARELRKRAFKRYEVAVFDVSEMIIAFDEKRSPRLSRTAGKTVDEAYEEIHGNAKEDAASRLGEGSREQPPL